MGQKFSAALESLKLGWGCGAKPTTPDSASSEYDANTPAPMECNSAMASAASIAAAADASSPQPTGAQLGGTQVDDSSSAHITSAAEFVAAAAATERLASGSEASSEKPRNSCAQPQAGHRSSGFEEDAARVEALGGGTGGGPKRPEMLYPAGGLPSPPPFSMP